MRPPVTIVVPICSPWVTTRAFLQSLRAGLTAGDQVVAVVPAATDGSPVATVAPLHDLPWVETVTASSGELGEMCNAGAAVAGHEVVVFVPDDTVARGRWLDPLTAPLFSRPEVAATGPRTDRAPTPQLVPGVDPAQAGSRQFARSWAAAHRGRTSAVDTLDLGCLAVRRSALRAVGGVPPGGDGASPGTELSRRLQRTGQCLVLCHEVFVHRRPPAGRAPGALTAPSAAPAWSRAQRRRPFVSACLIVKDEEENLPACLRSLAGFADELVVYDTGSADGTVAVARALGATVVEGTWDDDFSRARNAALARCSGDWIVWLDADETLQCDDPAALRDLLVRTKPEIDAWSVAIDNLTGAGVGAGFIHHAARIFRRTRCEWTGRLHEQVAIRGTHTGISQGMMEIARIRHTGYLDRVMQARNKTERNLRVAEREVAEADGWDRGFSLTSLGRSYLTAGRFEEARSHCAEALDHTDNVITRRLAMRSVAEALIGLGRYQESAEWIERLRQASGSPTQADAVEVKLALAGGDHGRALALLDGLGAEAHDEDGFEYSRPMLAQQRAEALAGLGRPGEAADILLAVLGDTGVLDRHLGEIVDHLQQAGRPLTELASRIPADREPVFLAQLLQLRDDAADAALEACFECRGRSTAVLAAAGNLARRLPVERALVWSARIRAAGFPDGCPLLAITAGGRSPLDRARAAATAHRAFDDPRAAPALLEAFTGASDAERQAIAADVDALCPSLAPLLHRHGAPEPVLPRS